jgi:hypothetical protein
MVDMPTWKDNRLTTEERIATLEREIANMQSIIQFLLNSLKVPEVTPDETQP